MEAVRITMDSAQLASIVDLPMTLRDREVKVIVLPGRMTPDTEELDNQETSVDSVKGILKEYADPALRKLEKCAWEQAAVEKYLEKMRDGRS